MTYYATAGLGYGVDISHYGAPYQGMLGLGQATWSPGPGQTPADDPRMVKKFAVVRSVYRVRNVPSDKAGRLADLLLSRARTLFQGSTVRKIGTTGWMNDGRVGFEVILAAATRAGEIKLRNATARDVASQLGGGAELYDAQTIISPTDYMPLEDTMLPPGEQPVATMESTETRTIGGLPIWAAAGIGVAALGALAFVMTRKKPVTSNRRKRVTRNARRTKKKSLPPGFVQLGDGGTTFIEEWDIEENLGGFMLGKDSKKNMTQFGHPQNLWAIPKKNAAAFRAKVDDAIRSELRHIERIESGSRRGW